MRFQNFVQYLSCILFTFVISASAFEPTDKVTVAKIDGTELYTGTFYTVDLKSSGRLTWSNTKVGKGYHLQVVYGSEAADYQPGKKFWNDCQWMIIPADETGFYQLVVKSKTHAVVATEGSAPSGKWVSLFMDADNDAQYQPGGERRNDALWSFNTDPKTTDNKYNTIFNKAYPKSGIVTWATTDVSAGKKWVEIYTGDIDPPTKYSSNADYLWKFTAVSYNLTGYISDLSSAKKTVDYYKDRSQKTYLFHSAGFLNKGNFLANVSTDLYFKGIQDTYVLKFNQNFKNFQTVSLSAEPLPGSLQASGDLKGGVITASNKKSYRWTQGKDYFVVQPKTCVNVSGYYLRFKGDEPFDASLSVSGVTEQMTFGRELTGKKQRVIGDAVKWYLSQTKFDGTLKTVERNRVNYGISGTLTADAGLSGNSFEVTEIDCDEAAALTEWDDPGKADPNE